MTPRAAHVRQEKPCPPPLQRQLSFGVEHAYPRDPDQPPMGGAIKISGPIAIPCDLKAGEKVLVVVSDADGQVLGQAEATASSPSFVDVFHKKTWLGAERIHKLKVDR